MYKTIIGLEIHVQLNTKSKMFCGCNNEAHVASPNSLVCPICLGLPGVLPKANLEAILKTLKTGLALNCEIPKISKFDRKHYFYPDLPKNYQISQYEMPFAQGGYLEIQDDKDLGKTRKINLIRIHLEEDAGKLIHTKEGTLIDLNRAGTPLMEIVTEPQINSPHEAKIFMQELRNILRFLSVSEASMEKGHLRCDANISLGLLADSQRQLGTPVEIKNLNSFRMVERALLYEEKRQKELLQNNQKIQKETRGWDDGKGVTISQRSKEFAQDYRYFPEPDLPKFNLEKYDLEKISNEIPELPIPKRQRFQNEYQINYKEAEVLTQDQNVANFYEEVARKSEPKLAASWIINELKCENIHLVHSSRLVKLINILQNGKITGKIGKVVLKNMLSGDQDPEEIIISQGLSQIADTGEITKIVEAVILENPKPVLDFQKGKDAALAFLIGQVMRKTQGQANPEMVSKILKERMQNGQKK